MPAWRLLFTLLLLVLFILRLLDNNTTGLRSRSSQDLGLRDWRRGSDRLLGLRTRGCGGHRLLRLRARSFGYCRFRRILPLNDRRNGLRRRGLTRHVRRARLAPARRGLILFLLLLL